MRLYKTRQGIVIEKENAFYLLAGEDWDNFINDDALLQKMEEKIKVVSPVTSLSDGDIVAPVASRHELWACGVTYLRSKIGRQEESKAAGGADFYGKVYGLIAQIRKHFCLTQHNRH